VDLFMVGVDEAKLMVMRRLAQSQPGPGYCHVPADRDADWYKQITAEKLVTRYVKGQPVREWHKHEKARNEALDCRVYAYAALKITLPNLKKIAERMKAIDTTEEWAKKTAEKAVKLAEALKKVREITQKPAEKQPENPPEEPKQRVVQTAPVRKASPAKAPKRRNFVNNW
jgi:phage terminase large subunit GpA-like protein